LELLDDEPLLGDDELGHDPPAFHVICANRGDSIRRALRGTTPGCGGGRYSRRFSGPLDLPPPAPGPGPPGSMTSSMAPGRAASPARTATSTMIPVAGAAMSKIP